MNELVTINEKQLETKEYQGKRVITAWDIAGLHEREVRKVNEQFSNNRERFIIGEDYFVIRKDEFSESFKRIQKFIPNNVKEIMLFTESVFIRYGKSI